MAKKATTKKATGRKVSASKPTARKTSPTKKNVAKKKGVSKKAAAKKTASKSVKKTSAKSAKKSGTSASASSKKKVAVKGAGKAVAKKVAKKKAPAVRAKQAAAVKSTAASKKTSTTTKKKVAASKAAKAASKPSSAKASSKKTIAKKSSVDKVSGAKSAETSSSSAKSAVKSVETKSEEGKSGRKGITIVDAKAKRKRGVAKKSPAAVPPLSGSILGMGLRGGRPLIQSGPKAPPVSPEQTQVPERSGKKPKSPFTKRQLEKYREILIQKRQELLGDIDSMETEALKSESGSLSHLPQHMAEQGSEAYEQTLALDLAATDRKLLLEIDAALDRIAARVYGLCELTGKEISKERLDELPWARYSIEAAREMERRAT